MLNGILNIYKFKNYTSTHIHLQLTLYIVVAILISVALWHNSSEISTNYLAISVMGSNSYCGTQHLLCILFCFSLFLPILLSPPEAVPVFAQSKHSFSVSPCVHFSSSS
jgi:hypothetical protein